MQISFFSKSLNQCPQQVVWHKLSPNRHPPCACLEKGKQFGRYWTCLSFEINLFTSIHDTLFYINTNSLTVCMQLSTPLCWDVGRTLFALCVYPHPIHHVAGCIYKSSCMDFSIIQSASSCNKAVLIPLAGLVQLWSKF